METKTQSSPVASRDSHVADPDPISHRLEPLLEKVWCLYRRALGDGTWLGDEFWTLDPERQWQLMRQWLEDDGQLDLLGGV